jgi:Amt family ammonium transporter
VGISIGAVAGMVAITPAAGYVGPSAAILIGLGAGLFSNLVSNWRARTHLDDSLDVFACHGMGAIWGMLATGIFATVAINSAGANGLLNGNPGLLGAQALGVGVVAAFSFFGSFALLKLINLITPLRVSPAEEEAGLDLSEHGEEAYA